MIIFPPPKREKKRMHSITRKSYLEAAQVFHWAYRKDYERYFHGELDKRDRRTEALLKEFENKGKLRVSRYGKPKIYSTPRRLKGKTNEEINPDLFLHGLRTTDCIVRFHRSDMKAKIISEKKFRGFGRKPDAGFLFPTGELLLTEFTTSDNWKRKKVLKNKVTTYMMILPDIVSFFNAETGFVLFVCDAPKEKIKEFVVSINGMSALSAASTPPPYEGDIPLDPFFFVDYESFKKVELGQQLTAKIYIWANDGKEYTLSE